MMIRNISANDYDVKDNENVITQTMSRWKILLRTNEDMTIAKEVHTQNTEGYIYLPGVFHRGVQVWMKHLLWWDQGMNETFVPSKH